DALQVAPGRIQIQMAMEMDVSGGGDGAVLKAIMSKSVDHDVIVRADQAPDDAVPRGPAGGIEHGMLELEKFRDAALKGQRILGIAQECRRAGAMDAIIVNRLFRRLFDGGMRT